MSNAWIDAQRDEWPLRYRTGTDLATDAWPHHRIVVTAGLHHLGSNERPHWSVTADIVNKRRRGDNALEAAGCMHDEILEHFPHLAPVVALHLSDDRGVPMHAVANAKYWLGLTSYTTVNLYGDRGVVSMPVLDILARHLRITIDDARAMSERWPVGSPFDPDAFAAEVMGHAERWQRESDEAVALLRPLA